MSGRILIVDDIAVNVRLLEAWVRAEYYEVVTATNGPEALALAESSRFDLVLLDVMMPGMDGYEVCRRLKANAATQHVPVVLITALHQAEDRLAGLKAGADDFLTKPVDHFALFSRLRSLTRLKLMTDEIRSRLDVVAEASVRRKLKGELDAPGTGGSVVLVTADTMKAVRIQRSLRGEQRVQSVSGDREAIEAGRDGRCDLVIVDLEIQAFDPLRLCAQLRAAPATRRTPILLLAGPSDQARVRKAIDIGANDYLDHDADASELVVRVRAQVRRRRFDETLRRSVKDSTEMAVRDGLTGLYNRRYLENALDELIPRSREEGKAFSVLIADLDHFKRVNDRWGHDAGDAVLQQFAEQLRATIREGDVACRYGGEEFVVLMQDTVRAEAQTVAERLRGVVAATRYEIDGEFLQQTVSVGIAALEEDDDCISLLKRADRGLYMAKDRGRNRVIVLAA